MSFGAFRTSKAADEYRDLYERFVARHWPIPSSELDVDTRFGTTRVRRSGPESGTPIVMIHPTTGASLGWHVLVGPVADHHPVYTPDTIGTAGLSVQTAPIETSTDLCRWLDDVLDGLSLERVHLVGYSEGGWIAGVHAGVTDRRRRIASLGLIEPGGAIERVPPTFLAAMIARGAATLVARDTPRAIQNFSRWLNGDIELSDDELELAMHVFRTFRQKLPTPDRLDDESLGRITMPTLLVLAEHTKLYDPASVSGRARRLLPDVQVETVPNAGHGVVYQEPDRVARMLVEFIDRVDGQSADLAAGS